MTGQKVKVCGQLLGDGGEALGLLQGGGDFLALCSNYSSYTYCHYLHDCTHMNCTQSPTW